MQISRVCILLKYGFELLLVLSVTLSTSMWQDHIHTCHLHFGQSSLSIRGGHGAIKNSAGEEIVGHILMDHHEPAIDICMKPVLFEPEEESDIFHPLALSHSSSYEARFQSDLHGSSPSNNPFRTRKHYLHKQSFLF